MSRADCDDAATWEAAEPSTAKAPRRATPRPIPEGVERIRIGTIERCGGGSGRRKKATLKPPLSIKDGPRANQSACRREGRPRAQRVRSRASSRRPSLLASDEDWSARRSEGRVRPARGRLCAPLRPIARRWPCPAGVAARTRRGSTARTCGFFCRDYANVGTPLRQVDGWRSRASLLAGAWRSYRAIEAWPHLHPGQRRLVAHCGTRFLRESAAAPLVMGWLRDRRVAARRTTI